jgi:glycine cleavage system H protein
MKRPENARYSETHEWAILKGDVLTLGVTDWAVEHLGDLVYVDLPDPGTELETGDTACEVESVKAVGEVYSPVDGTVTEVNAGLADDPAPLAADPYGKGWLVKIKVKDSSGLKKLLDLKGYEKHLESADAG